jgi:O-antigen ligase
LQALRSLPLERGLVFAAVAGLVAWMALRGGSYDLVVRQEVALAVWVLLAAGFASGVLPRARPPVALAFSLASLATLIALTVLSLSWTTSDERTVNELIRLLGYGGLVVLVWATVSRHTWRAAAAGLALAAVAVCAVALGCRLFPGTFPEDTVARIFAANRLSFPFDYWNAVGAWGAMSVGLTLGWSAHARSPLGRAAALAAVPLCALPAYLAYSRGAVIGVAIAIVAVMVVSRNRWSAALHAVAAATATAAMILAVRDEPQIATGAGGEGGGRIALLLLAAAGACAAVAVLAHYARVDRLRLPRRVAAVATPVLVVMALGAGVAAGGDSVSREWERFRSGEPVSSGGGEDPAARLVSGGGNRSAYWESAIDAFELDELRGLGPGTFELWWAKDPLASEFVRDAHSLYFEQLAELGLPGLAALLAFLLGLLWLAFRSRLVGPNGDGDVTPLIVCFVVYLSLAGVDWFWEYPALTGLALIAACAAGAARSRPAGAPGVGMRVALAGLALVCSAAQVPGIVATERTRASATALAAGDGRKAGSLAGEAITAEPWAASTYNQRALAELARGRLGRARTDAREAHERDPGDYRYLFTLTEIELRAGAPNRAAEHFRDASELRRSSEPLAASQAYADSLFLRILAALRER